MKRPSSILSRLLLLIGGVAVALVLAEVSLWVAGPFIAPPARAPADAAGWRVLCVGDSFVYGLGSEDGLGMCEHLQVLLDEQWGPGVASVHNEGVPGFNSSQAADRLVVWLEGYDPDVVLLLVGHNNSWNFNDLHLGLVEGGQGMGAARALGKLRLVRLLRLVTRYDQDSEASGAAGSADPALEAWSHAARKANKQAKFGREIRILEARLADHPGDVYTMLRLAQAREAAGDQAGADALRDQARGVDPDAVAALEDAQRRVERFHHEQAERGEDAYLRESAAADAALRGVIGDRDSPEQLADEQRRVLYGVLQADLAAMASQARDQGAAVVLAGYPQHKPANEFISAAAAEIEVPYVDHQADFERRLAGHDDLSPWFLLDSHCTSAGYRIMAENLLPVLLPLGPDEATP